MQASPGDVVTVVEAVAQLTTPSEPASVGALQQATAELTPTLNDAVTQTGTAAIQNHPTPESKGINSVVQASGVLRIIFHLP